MNISRRRFLIVSPVAAAGGSLLIREKLKGGLLSGSNEVAAQAVTGWEIPWSIPWNIGEGPPIPTPTPTLIPTVTQTPTSTPTATETPVPSATVAPTSTETPTSTPTGTETPTVTPSPYIVLIPAVMNGTSSSRPARSRKK